MSNENWLAPEKSFSFLSPAEMEAQEQISEECGQASLPAIEVKQLQPRKKQWKDKDLPPLQGKRVGLLEFSSGQAVLFWRCLQSYLVVVREAVTDNAARGINDEWGNVIRIHGAERGLAEPPPAGVNFWEVDNQAALDSLVEWLRESYGGVLHDRLGGAADQLLKELGLARNLMFH